MAKPTPVPGTIKELVEQAGKDYDPTKFIYSLIRHRNESSYRSQGYEVLGEVKDSTADPKSTMLAVSMVRPRIPVAPPPSKPPPARKPSPPKQAAPRTPAKPPTPPKPKTFGSSLFRSSKS